MKKRLLFKRCIDEIVGACTAKPAEEAWVKVEGNKFISHGKISGKLTPAMLQTSIL